MKLSKRTKEIIKDLRARKKTLTQSQIAEKYGVSLDWVKQVAKRHKDKIGT